MADLSAVERALYVRQIMLPEVGVAGQERLLAARFHAPASPAGAIAARYLERAGLRSAHADEGALCVQPSSSEVSDAPIEDCVRGAFEAVEVIKRVLGVGRRGQLPSGLLAPPSPCHEEAEAE